MSLQIRIKIVECPVLDKLVLPTGGRETSPELQAAVVDVIDQRKCDRLLRPNCNRHWCGVKEHQLCAGKLAGGVDACQVIIMLTLG